MSERSPHHTPEPVIQNGPPEDACLHPQIILTTARPRPSRELPIQPPQPPSAWKRAPTEAQRHHLFGPLANRIPVQPPHPSGEVLDKRTPTTYNDDVNANGA